MKITDLPFGIVKNNKIILNPWNGNPAKEIGEVRDDGIDASIQYFSDRFDELVDKIDELDKTIEETDNKGSYLQKVLYLRGYILEHNGLGDYASLDEKLVKHQEMLKEIIGKNRIRNTEIKKILIKELNEALEIINWKESTEVINDIKSRWIQVGNALPDQQDELNNTFWTSVKNYFERKHQFFEDRKKLEKKAEDNYKKLVRESEQLVYLFGNKRTEREELLKEKWRELDKIPAFKYKQLASKFQFNIKKRPIERSSDPEEDLKEIEKVLAEMQQGQRRFEKQAAERIRATLKSIRSKDHRINKRRRDCQEMLHMLTDINFVQLLCRKRNSDFDVLPIIDQNALQVLTLKDLMSRDEEELEQFESNMVNFNSGNSNLNNVMERKIANQKNKIKIKKRLISILGG